MSEVVVRLAARVLVDESDEYWHETSQYLEEEDLADCVTVHDIASKLFKLVLRIVNVPNGPIAMEQYISSEADYGKGYARVSVKYICKCRGEALKISAATVCDENLPVLPQSAILNAAAKICTGAN